MGSGRRSILFVLAGLAAGGLAAYATGLPGGTKTVTTTRTVRATVTVARGHALSPPQPVPRGPLDFTREQADLSTLVPADAAPTDERWLSTEKGEIGHVVVTWKRELASGLTQQGLVVWQRNRLFRWRRVYSLVTHTGNYPDSVDELRVTTGDVTGDGYPDVLIDEALLGTGQCGTFILLGTIERHLKSLFHEFACGDKRGISLAPGALLVVTGLDKDPATRQDIHCCYLRIRRTLLRWRGSRVLRSVSVGPNPNDPFRPRTRRPKR